MVSRRFSLIFPLISAEGVRPEGSRMIWMMIGDILWNVVIQDDRPKRGRETGVIFNIVALSVLNGRNLGKKARFEKKVLIGRGMFIYLHDSAVNNDFL
jgi:hypothetical protein